MANLTPVAGWSLVFQLELTTPALAGPGGVMNSQAQALLNRTEYLKKFTFVDSTQAPNAYCEFVVPEDGTNYRDNMWTMENRSKNADGKRGNAAIRFRQASPDGGTTLKPERGAIGYSAPSADNPAYVPNLLYMEGGNLTAGDTDDTDIALRMTHLPGCVNFPDTYYNAVYCKSSNGEVTVQAGPSADRTIYLRGHPAIGEINAPRVLSMWGKSSTLRFGERDSDDLFSAWTNCDKTTAQDNVAKSSWRVEWGHGTGADMFAVHRMAAGGSTWAELFKVQTSMVYVSTNVSVGALAAPKQWQMSGLSTWLRIRERDDDDLFALTTNVDTGTTKDNTAKSAWRFQMGHGAGEDQLRLSRMPVGSSTWADLLIANVACIAVTVPIANRAKTVSVPTSGNSLSMADTEQHRIVDPAGTLAALTVALPAVPQDGQTARITFTQIITALTLSSGGTIRNTYTSATAGQVVSFVYHTATTTWFRV